MDPVSALSEVLIRLFGEAPALVSYLGGLVAALVYRKRYPRPCRYLLAGCGVLLATTLAATIVQTVLIRAWMPNLDVLTMQKNVFIIVGFGTGILYAIGFALVVVATLTDRRPPPRPNGPLDEDDRPWQRPAAPPANPTGIQESRR